MTRAPGQAVVTIHDYLPADTWCHGMEDGEPDGVRIFHSTDRPGSMAVQIRHNGRVCTARMTPELIGELHRQAMS